MSYRSSLFSFWEDKEKNWKKFYLLVKIHDHIVTCVGVRVTKVTGSDSDDWIY
jgi:hypothetical protein